ncbi:hypothetical protein RAZWK3B_11962 [Roseobacter sp. AzwK-3b]|uniref:hypothetical protein n=1 Tax=Roseobacter sp. AzwK-3b TaxID=351016 RepID=UPI000156A74C|nr:hypothetical protein [Roseobacter sp. AzwK-3b]EDM69611.1 hypothetical protein RAZWK3B_11962 [Roseobacter sp. AzwK-3b]
MAKDFAELNRLENEAGIQAPEAGTKEQLVNKFVKAWENETARRAVKGGTGLSMALTLAACGGSSGGGFAFAPSTQGPAPTTPIENLIALVDGGITAITGADPIIEVASPTAGADALATTIGAGGTGTLTLRFDDAEDVVTLDAASDLSGYDTLAIAAGTVDVTAVDLTGIASITVSSGVTLTAAQFLGLSGGVTGGSADSSVTIIVSSIAEANDVIAAVASLGGTLGADSVTFEAAAGSTVTAGNLVTLNGQLDAAIEAAATVDALPQAIQAVEAAVAAQDAFVATAVANEDVVTALGAVDPADATYAQADAAIDAAIVTEVGAIDAASVVVNFVAAHATSAAAAQAAITDIRAELTTAQETATTAVSAAATAVDDPALTALADDVVAARQAAIEAVEAEAAASAATTAAIAEVNDPAAAVLAYDNNGTLSFDADGVGVGVGVNFATAVNGTITLVDAAVTVDAAAGTYTINAEVLDAAEIDAVIAAAQAELDAEEALLAANTARTDAEDALVAGAEVANFGALPAVVTDYIAAVEALAVADDNLATFEANVVDYNDLVSLADQTDTLDQAVTDAEAAITDAAPDGLGIDILAAAGGNVAFDAPGAQAEVYSYDAGDALLGVLTVADFDADGSDRLYMGAGEYSFVELAATDTIPDDNLGSATTLEIFAEETAAGVTLWVEQVATAGNGTTGSDMIQVEVAGLDLADLSFDAVNGILTAETPIA